jgi:transmembrane sensor
MDRLNALFEKYKNNLCSPEELEELLVYFRDVHQEDPLKAQIDEYLYQEVADQAELEETTSEVYRRIQARINDRSKILPLKPWKWIAAASVLLFLSIGGYFLLHKPVSSPLVNNSYHNDIAPGSNKAILTLAGGRQIILSEAKNGKLAEQGNTAINKTADGEVVYSPSKALAAGINSEELNTITVPRGGQHLVVLADGTKAWLNSASSLKYPVSFIGKERKVALTGEAYFEVAHNAAQPFIVSSGGQTVEVLGTHFNINGYADDPAIKTTLLEGSVRIAKNGQTTILRPGQQSIVQATGNAITVNEADTELAVAWRSGLFMFDEDKLDDIMRKIARWYDVDVIFTDNRLKDKLTSGSVSRFGNVSQVLKKIEMTGGVHFTINGRIITVEPK